MELLTHEMIVSIANAFAMLPDHWSITLLGGELTFNGDGSFITGRELGRHIY